MRTSWSQCVQQADCIRDQAATAKHRRVAQPWRSPVVRVLYRQAMSGKSGRRSPRSQREMFRKIHACALELLAKLGHSYVISALSREPLFSISEDREVVCKEGASADPLRTSTPQWPGPEMFQSCKHHPSHPTMEIKPADQHHRRRCSCFPVKIRVGGRHANLSPVPYADQRTHHPQT